MKANSYLYKYDYNSSRGMWIGHIYDDKNQHIKFMLIFCFDNFKSPYLKVV